MLMLSALLLGGTLGLSSESSALDVPLIVFDTASVVRKQDVCSSGIWLPCGALEAPDDVAVFDSAGKAVPAQFRVLERWREKAEGKDDLSVKWLLVTFLADVPAGGKAEYRLKAGENPAPAAPVRIQQKGNTWEMGGLSFNKDFTAPFKLVLTDGDGKQVSTEGQQIKWSVWESGPLRACLRAESPTDHDKFGFIAWIYAYAGQKRWDMTFVLKNTPNDMKGPFYFKDFSVIWAPPEVQDAGDFILGGDSGKPVAGTLEGSSTAYLMQASCGTDKWDKPNGNSNLVMDWTKDLSKAKAGVGAFRGYKVLAGKRELGAGNFAAGWATLNSSRAGACAFVRDYHHQWPKATEIESGKIVLRLWPKYAKGFGGLHWLDDCTRKAYDLSFRLGSALIEAADAEAADRAFNHPLVAAPPPDWLLAQGVIRPTGKLYPPKPFTGGEVPGLTGSGRNWVTWGGDITDRIRRRYHGADMDGFLRTGDPTRAYKLLRVARHSSGMTPLWLDDYQYPRDVEKLTHAQYCGLARDAGEYRPGTWQYGYKTWNAAHFCCQEVFDAWRIFGDPLALDAITTIGRWSQAWVDFRESGGGLIAGTRADGLPFYNLAEAYRILGDRSMRKSLDRMAEICWNQVNKDRGNYGVMDRWEGGQDKCEKPFMMAQVIQGMKAHYALTGSERTRDQILGMVDFIRAESSMGEWGFHYVVFIDPKQNDIRIAAARRKLDEDPKPENRKNVSYGHISWIMAWAFRYTGEERFRQAIDGLSGQAYPHTKWAYTNHYPERTDNSPPETIRDLSVEALGGGKVRLTWTAPAGGAVLYQVKWAEREMVERLKYPEEKDTKANWWSANQVENEPTPGAAGTSQALTVEGVSSGNRFFAVRSFDAAENRSGLSNKAAVDVK